MRTGRRVAPVEFDDRVLDMLIRTRWMDDGEVHDSRQVGRALSEMIRDTARRPGIDALVSYFVAVEPHQSSGRLIPDWEDIVDRQPRTTSRILRETRLLFCRANGKRAALPTGCAAASLSLSSAAPTVSIEDGLAAVNLQPAALTITADAPTFSTIM